MERYDSAPLLRSERSLAMEISLVINGVLLRPDNHARVNGFIESTFPQWVANPAFSGEALEPHIQTLISEHGPRPVFVSAALCFAADCARAMRQQSERIAWSYAVDARVYLSGVRWLDVLVNAQATHASEAARNAVAARHRKTSQAKQEAIDWFLSHRDMYPNKTVAAADLAKDFDVLTFNTIRKALQGL